MKTKKEIFIPKWQRWYISPLLLIVWAFTTYLEFFSPDTTEKMGLVGWVFMTLILFIVGVMTWLMTSGRLPAYIIEETVEK